MKILYVASEATPFLKTGGLADVAGSLPKALNELGCDCRVVMPLFGQIGGEYRSMMKKIASFYVDIGWKHEYCGVFEARVDNLIYYFLDNEYYFKRSQVYGEGDDYERFIFFSKAATRLARVLDFKVDVIHANDWHSGLVPVYVNDYRTGDRFYENIRTLFSIHNLKYQGQYAPQTFYWTNLAGYYMSDFDLKFHDSINFLKGGIVHATKVNTVSETYAQEIRYPFYAEGLESVIQHYTGKISGILNGIDYDVWNSMTDPYIAANYDLSSIEKRKENKLALQEKVGLPKREDVQMIGMVTRFTAMKGLDLVRYLLDELLQEDIQFVVLGTGDRTYEEMFEYFQWRYPEKMAARIFYSNEESHQIYSACDFFLMPSLSEPCGLSQMIAMRYGSVPIVREVGGLRDSVNSYNRIEKTGEGFSFSNINAHDLLHVIRLAIDTYHNNPDDYRMLQKNGMEKDLSWSVSSRHYLDLYKSMF